MTNHAALDPSTLCHCERLEFAETTCRLESDSDVLGKTLCAWKCASGEGQCDFTLRVRVMRGSDALEPTSFRGAAHLVLAQYGTNLFLFDLRRKTVDARVSEDIADDAGLWARRFIPLMLGVLGTTIGVLPLHSACVVHQGKGILLAGASTAGKSTLSVALAKEGFELLSDDWTYIRSSKRALRACGLDVPVKLLPDTAQYFPELQPLATVRTVAGETAYEVSARDLSQVAMASRCLPAAFVFLERVEDGPSTLRVATPGYIREYVANSVERLPQELHEAICTRAQLIDALSQLPAWVYRYSAKPQAAAAYLARFCASQFEVISQ